MKGVVFAKNKYFYIAALSLFFGVFNLSASVFLVYAQVSGEILSKNENIAANDIVFDELINKIDTQTVNYTNYTNKNAKINNDIAQNQTSSTVSEKDSQTKNEVQISVLPVRIKISKLSKDLPVKNPNTTDIETLNKMLLTAVLRYPGTARLSDKTGNMVIFGHSSHLPQHKIIHKMYTAFNDIEKLRYDDRIEVIGEDGAQYIYRVRRVYKAKASKAQIYIKTNKKMLTLITCDNFGAKEDRWIVEAEFIAIARAKQNVRLHI